MTLITNLFGVGPNSEVHGPDYDGKFSIYDPDTKRYYNLDDFDFEMARGAA